MIVILLLLIPSGPVYRDSVDVVEVNHVHGIGGTHSFSQVIYWDGGQIVDWRMLKNKNQRPAEHPHATGCVNCWIDDGRLRVVKAKVKHESWTTHDPEVLERVRFPMESRAGLAK